MLSDERVRILVADDVAFFRRYLGGVLRRVGFEILEADSDVRLLEQMQLGPVNLVLLDVDLPERRAEGLLPLIRDLGPPKPIPVLLLTSRVGSVNRKYLQELGADGCIHRHAPPEHIVYSVRQPIAVPDQDRRMSPRRLADSPICFDGGGQEGVGRLVDIGTGGLQLQTLSPTPARETGLRLSFVFPGSEEVMLAEGRVVRTEPLRFSVAFTKLEERVRAAILRYMKGVDP